MDELIFTIAGPVRVIHTEKKTTQNGVEYFVHSCAHVSGYKKVYFSVSGPQEDSSALDFASGVHCTFNGIYGGEMSFRLAVDPFADEPSPTK